MTGHLIVGVDPGLTTGVAAFTLDRRRILSDPPPVYLQIHGVEGVLPLVGTLLERAEGARTLAVETFVVGPRAARSGTPAAGKAARRLITCLQDLADELGADFVQRSASQVKPWATDTRLAAVSLIAHAGTAAGPIPATKGMPHARDAARHALFEAVHSGNLIDPLSRANLEVVR